MTTKAKKPEPKNPVSGELDEQEQPTGDAQEQPTGELAAMLEAALTHKEMP